MMLDVGPLIVDGDRVNSKLWALIRRTLERDGELHTTHPVLAQVWREPGRQANLARFVKHCEVHALDDSVAVGRRLAASGTSDVVDAHLVVVAEQLGTYVFTTDPGDMRALGARFETY